MIELAHPWLLLLLPLPVLVVWGVPALQRKRVAVRVPNLQRLARVTGGTPAPGAVVVRRGALQTALLAVVWALVVVALAQPQHILPPITKELPTRDLLLAVDLSGSMEARDFTDASGAVVERLDAVKQVLDGFLARRDGDRVGLLVFGTAAFVQAPFTADLDVVRELLGETRVRMAGPQTVIGDAIGLALTVFERSEVEERVLILLTDGNDTGSLVPPERAAEIARDQGVVIHTVAVGDPAAVGEDALDAESLAAVARKTGGRAYFAGDREGLEGIYVELDALNPRRVETLSHRPRQDRFHWPLGGAVGLVLAVLAARELRGAWRRSRALADPVPPEAEAA